MTVAADKYVRPSLRTNRCKPVGLLLWIVGGTAYLATEGHPYSRLHQVGQITIAIGSILMLFPDDWFKQRRRTQRRVVLADSKAVVGMNRRRRRPGSSTHWSGRAMRS